MVIYTKKSIHLKGSLVLPAVVALKSEATNMQSSIILPCQTFRAGGGGPKVRISFIVTYG